MKVKTNKSQQTVFLHKIPRGGLKHHGGSAEASRGQRPRLICAFLNNLEIQRLQFCAHVVENVNEV